MGKLLQEPWQAARVRHREESLGMASLALFVLPGAHQDSVRVGCGCEGVRGEGTALPAQHH